MSKPLPPGGPVVETHAATSKAQCEEMERRLKAQGLKLDLIDTELTGDDLLSTLCLFTGLDANPEANRWKTYSEDD
jgi:hypothetical protein